MKQEYQQHEVQERYSTPVAKVSISRGIIRGTGYNKSESLFKYKAP
jgi:hypothetical protein